MSASKLLVYRMVASRAQIRTTFGIALALFLIFIAVLFFRTQVLRPTEPFVPVTSTILIMADWITAALLVAQALVLRARPLHLLAAGYFLAGLFVVLRVLSLPDVLVDPDPSFDIPLWFYLASHGMLPLAVICYAWLNRATSQPASFRSPVRSLAGLIVAAGSVILAVTIAETSLPWTSTTVLMASVVMFLVIVAVIMLGLTLHSVLDLWLMLVLLGWFLETALIALSCPSYTVGWYAGRSLGALSGLLVLFALLVETSKLYTQTVLQLMAQKQEREHRALIRDAITASIAHELRQPLSAMLLNAEAGKRLLSTIEGGPVPPLGEIAATLDDIVASGLRANSIIESTRNIFGQGNSPKKALTDMGALLNSTLAMVAVSARANDVFVELVLDGKPKPIALEQLQMQQALLNLFQNAIEALAYSCEPGRTLRVHCMPWPNSQESPRSDRGMTIRVEDNGPGIPSNDRERIFDVFFTTRVRGAGMGLAIARSVIEAHGGRLDVEPRRPTGTAFVIHLPYGDSGGLDTGPRATTGTAFALHAPYGDRAAG